MTPAASAANDRHQQTAPNPAPVIRTALAAFRRASSRRRSKPRNTVLQYSTNAPARAATPNNKSAVRVSPGPRTNAATATRSKYGTAVRLLTRRPVPTIAPARSGVRANARVVQIPRPRSVARTNSVATVSANWKRPNAASPSTGAATTISSKRQAFSTGTERAFTNMFRSALRPCAPSNIARAVFSAAVRGAYLARRPSRSAPRCENLAPGSSCARIPDRTATVRRSIPRAHAGRESAPSP